MAENEPRRAHPLPGPGMDSPAPPPTGKGVSPPGFIPGYPPRVVSHKWLGRRLPSQPQSITDPLTSTELYCFVTGLYMYVYLLLHVGI